jgi:hypothetical protein
MTFNIPDPDWTANMSHLVQHFRIGDTVASATPENTAMRAQLLARHYEWLSCDAFHAQQQRDSMP